MFANHPLIFFHRIASSASKSKTFPLSQPLVPRPSYRLFPPFRPLDRDSQHGRKEGAAVDAPSYSVFSVVS